MDERLKKMLGMQSMFGRQPEFNARTGIAQSLPEGKSPFSQQMQDTMGAAVADYGTKPNSQQTYMLSQQDMAFDTNSDVMPDKISGAQGFDFGKLATALGSGSDEMAPVDTRPANAGQQIQPIQIYGGGAPQMGVSGAMNAIQQGQGQMGMGGAMNPEMLRRMRGF
jgi:hypothetical protein